MKTPNNIGDVDHGNCFSRSKYRITHSVGDRKEAKPMTVGIISKSGKRLMPTKRLGKVRNMLRDGRAVVVGRRPFTVQLTYETTEYTAEKLELAVDTGYQYAGLSVKSNIREYDRAQFNFLQNEKEKHDDQRSYRRTRRNRRRYRAPRFNNRVRSKREGWLAPSIRNKIDRHLDIIDRYVRSMPITDIILEVGQFDPRVLDAVDKGLPLPEGLDYQHGPMYGVNTLREAVFQRDHYKCCFCGRSALKNGAILHVHHTLFWKGIHRDRVSELTTACEKCHTPPNHKPGGKLWGAVPKDFVKGYPEATFMNQAKWALYNAVKAKYGDSIHVHITYGAATKESRIGLGLEKSHTNDAFSMGVCHPSERAEESIFQKVRRNNRILSRFYDSKYIDSRDGSKKSGAQLFNGRINRNHKKDSENLHKYRAQKVSKGRTPTRTRRYPFQPGDEVLYKGKVVRIAGAQHYGEYLAVKGQKAIKAKDVRIYKYAGGWVQSDAS